MKAPSFEESSWQKLSRYPVSQYEWMKSLANCRATLLSRLSRVCFKNEGRLSKANEFPIELVARRWASVSGQSLTDIHLFVACFKRFRPPLAARTSRVHKTDRLLTCAISTSNQSALLRCRMPVSSGINIKSTIYRRTITRHLYTVSKCLTTPSISNIAGAMSHPRISKRTSLSRILGVPRSRHPMSLRIETASLGIMSYRAVVGQGPLEIRRSRTNL